MKHPLIVIMFTACSLVSITAWPQSAASSGDVQRGKQLWNRSFTTSGEARSCTSCHTPDPRSAGKHKRTSKPIKPMAPSVNPQRLSDPKKMAKWFKRNCKWTIGRACTEQEKADIITYLNSL